MLGVRSSKPLSENQPALRERLDRFFSQWQSHGEAVSGRWRILDGRFLVVLREPEGAEVSGCSIDTMVGEVKQLERELDTRLWTPAGSSTATRKEPWSP